MPVLCRNGGDATTEVVKVGDVTRWSNGTSIAHSSRDSAPGVKGTRMSSVHEHGQPWYTDIGI